MSNESLSNVRINFLRAFEAAFGRGKQVVTRKELLEWQKTWAKDQKGGMGLKLRFPSWLCNTDQYKLSRGQFKIPWDALEEYEAKNGVSSKTSNAGNSTPTENAENSAPQTV